MSNVQPTLESCPQVTGYLLISSPELLLLHHTSLLALCLNGTGGKIAKPLLTPLAVSSPLHFLWSGGERQSVHISERKKNLASQKAALRDAANFISDISFSAHIHVLDCSHLTICVRLMCLCCCYIILMFYASEH